MHDQDTGQSSGSRFDDNPNQTSSGESTLKEKARSTGTAIKEKAQETKDRVMNKGAEAMQQAKTQTREMADERKNRLGERIHGYGSAFHRAAEKLREEQDPNIAHYTKMVAERIDQAADYIQSRDPGMLLRDAQNAARRRPEIFFGGMFLAGLVLARFLKASEQRDDLYSDESDEDYWVEDSENEEPAEDIATNPNFAMTSGEAAGDWQLRNEPGQNP